MRNLLVAVAVMVGCGSSTSDSTGGAATQADLNDSCAQSCAAQKRCTSTVDEATCVNKCKNDAASFAGKIRADYLALVNDCVRTASCDKLNACDQTSKASIAPTATVQTFCDELLKKNVECKAAATDKARCLENFKVFSDNAIDAARTCFSKACGDYGSCVLSTLGAKL